MAKTKAHIQRLRKADHIIRICEALVSSYGATLAEGDTDLAMAKKVYKVLKPHLWVEASNMTTGEFKKWRKKFLNQKCYDEDNH